jgi:hypothetical protein
VPVCATECRQIGPKSGQFDRQFPFRAGRIGQRHCRLSVGNTPSCSLNKSLLRHFNFTHPRPIYVSARKEHPGFTGTVHTACSPRGRIWCHRRNWSYVRLPFSILMHTIAKARVTFWPRTNCITLKATAYREDKDFVTKTAKKECWDHPTVK